MDSELNGALLIVTGCLLPTPSEYLLVLSGIQPVEFRRQGATLFITNRGRLDPDHILPGKFTCVTNVNKEILKCKSVQCGSTEQTADRIISHCFTHRAPQGILDLAVWWFTLAVWRSRLVKGCSG